MENAILVQDGGAKAVRGGLVAPRGLGPLNISRMNTSYIDAHVRGFNFMYEAGAKERFKLVYEHGVRWRMTADLPLWSANDYDSYSMNHNRSLDTLDHWIPGSRTYEWTVYRHDDPKVPQPGTSRDWHITTISHFNLVRSAEGKLFSLDASSAELERLVANKRFARSKEEQEQGGWKMLETMVEQFRQTGISIRYA